MLGSFLEGLRAAVLPRVQAEQLQEEVRACVCERACVCACACPHPSSSVLMPDHPARAHPTNAQEQAPPPPLPFEAPEPVKEVPQAASLAVSEAACLLLKPCMHACTASRARTHTRAAHGWRWEPTRPPARPLHPHPPVPVP